MKNLLILLIISTFSLQASSQLFKKNKGEEKKSTPSAADSITIENHKLMKLNDSLNLEVIKYKGVYTALKEKVFKYDFDPDKTGALIDSLRSVRDSSFNKMALQEKTSKGDTAWKAELIALKKENARLKIAGDSIQTDGNAKLNALTTEEIERSKAIAGLKELKELYDSKIITEPEFIAAKKKYISKL